MININDFKKVELRVGTIISVDEFSEAEKPAFKLKIDFGGFGIKQSSAQVTEHYSSDDLLKEQVVAIVNFPPKKIKENHILYIRGPYSWCGWTQRRYYAACFG